MKRNMKASDRLLRLVLGAALINIILSKNSIRFWSIFLIVIGIILIATSLTGYSPIYKLFSSNDDDKNKQQPNKKQKK